MKSPGSQYFLNTAIMWGVVRTPPHWPVVRPDLYIGYIERLFVVAIGPGVSDQDMIQCTDEIGLGIDTRSDEDRVVVMYHLSGKFKSDISALKRISTMVRARQAKLQRTTVALALCTRSTTGRAAFRTILSLANLPYPTTVVDTPAAGLAYLQKQMPTIDRERLLAEYERTVRRYAPGLFE